MLRDLRVYLLPDGHEYVAVAAGDGFLLYRSRPNYLGEGGPSIFEALPDGTVRNHKSKIIFCGVEELIDTGRSYR